MTDESRNQADEFARISIHADSPRLAARHGPIEQMRPDVFFVRGRMHSTPSRPSFERAFVRYSRTMTIVRSQNAGGDFELSLFNAIRLNDASLQALSKLGRIRNVIRLGSFHGVDDAFYVKQYDASYWVVDGMDTPPGMVVQPRLLAESSPPDRPIPNSDVFIFEGLTYPEAIYLLPPKGDESGIAITTDSIQNHESIWARDNSLAVSIGIARIGLKGPARLGPIWLRQQAPKVRGAKSREERSREIADFFRPQFERLLSQHDFDALAPGHGTPMKSGAKTAIGSSMESQLPLSS